MPIITASTGNVLTAGFDHATARPLSKKEMAAWLAANDNLLPGWSANDNIPPDPHWHKHLLVWNATYDPVEDRIKAGQLGDVVRDKGYYRAAFYSRLAEKLERLGYVIDRRGGKNGKSPGCRNRSSTNSASGRTKSRTKPKSWASPMPPAKAELGAKTRSKKQKELTLPELRKAWHAQLTDARAAGPGGGVPARKSRRASK